MNYLTCQDRSAFLKKILALKLEYGSATSWKNEIDDLKNKSPL